MCKTEIAKIECDFNDEEVVLEPYSAYQYLGFLPDGACPGCKIKHVKSAKKHAVTHVNDKVIMCAELDGDNPTSHLANLIQDNRSFDDVRETKMGTITEKMRFHQNYHKPLENLP